MKIPTDIIFSDEFDNQFVYLADVLKLIDDNIEQVVKERSINFKLWCEENEDKLQSEHYNQFKDHISQAKLYDLFKQSA